MLTKEVLDLLGRKGKMFAGTYYNLHEKEAMISKDWFSTGFRQLVTDSVNYALEQMGKTERVELLSSNTANAVGSRIDPN